MKRIDLLNKNKIFDELNVKKLSSRVKLYL